MSEYKRNYEESLKRMRDEGSQDGYKLSPMNQFNELHQFAVNRKNLNM